MIRRPPRSTLSSSSAASDVYKRQVVGHANGAGFPLTVELAEGLPLHTAGGARRGGARPGVVPGEVGAVEEHEVDVGQVELLEVREELSGGGSEAFVHVGDVPMAMRGIRIALAWGCLLYTSPSPRDS
eukprot:TRINITY_DN18967_c0_g1_i3.p1 TRINITY_DN18967_c0_g1~~TRINITY_DN18967_c0_g1_i3.p1  ORF type:complete len:128 (+),score=23.99 TRINITY_DN18967_c0_g1_i3:131-514(+)